MQADFVSVLKSNAGDWVFYDNAALQVAITAHVMYSGNVSIPATHQARQEQAMNGPPLSCDAHAKLLEGFTIEQWASYAKRKAHIASAICKENGVLKARLRDLGFHTDASENFAEDSAKRSTQEDQVLSRIRGAWLPRRTSQQLRFQARVRLALTMLGLNGKLL